MPTNRHWSDADRELVRTTLLDCRWDAMSIEQAEAVLDALTAAGKLADPAHDARVRADERTRVAEEIAAAAAIARAHATTEEAARDE